MKAQASTRLEINVDAQRVTLAADGAVCITDSTGTDHRFTVGENRFELEVVETGPPPPSPIMQIRAEEVELFDWLWDVMAAVWRYVTYVERVETGHIQMEYPVEERVARVFFHPAAQVTVSRVVVV